MTGRTLNAVVDYIHRIAAVGQFVKLTDGELVERFIATQDEEAFGALIHRHGPLVLSVCQRVLHNIEDAEDAFQATFLVLVRKARSIAKQDSVASWLHGVAHRIAVRATIARSRRQAVERQVRRTHPADSLNDVVMA
jgi:RNA polymerase sigma-70 factor (ECF subfamily)